MIELHPIMPKEKLLEAIRETQRHLGISSSEIGRSIGLQQSQSSNLLNQNSKNPRDLSYDDAYQILQYIYSKNSLIPPDLKAGDLMTGNCDLKWAYYDQTLAEVSDAMFRRGFSQMPVKDRSGFQRHSVVTDLSILKAFMRRNGNEAPSLEQLGKMTLSELNIAESLLEFPADSPLLEIANILLDYPAVLIYSKAEIIGILTRADLLKLLTANMSLG
jgi:predicted transcriptional regulator